MTSTIFKDASSTRRIAGSVEKSFPSLLVFSLFTAVRRNLRLLVGESTELLQVSEDTIDTCEDGLYKLFYLNCKPQTVGVLEDILPMRLKSPPAA